MKQEKRKRLTVMLKRIQGQVGGIGRMVDGEKDCEAILTQVSAAMSSLKSVGKKLLLEEAVGCGRSSELKKNYTKLLERYL